MLTACGPSSDQVLQAMLMKSTGQPTSEGSCVDEVAHDASRTGAREPCLFCFLIFLAMMT